MQPDWRALMRFEMQVRSEGHVSVVKLLLTDPRVHPATNNNVAIVDASCKGHSGVVKLLLADPKLELGADVQLQVAEGHSGFVKLLLAEPIVCLC
jgi:hypothetical protein